MNINQLLQRGDKINIIDFLASECFWRTPGSYFAGFNLLLYYSQV